MKHLHTFESFLSEVNQPANSPKVEANTKLERETGYPYAMFYLSTQAADIMIDFANPGHIELIKLLADQSKIMDDKGVLSPSDIQRGSRLFKKVLGETVAYSKYDGADCSYRLLKTPVANIASTPLSNTKWYDDHQKMATLLEKKSNKIKRASSINEGINYNDAVDADLYDVGAYVIQGSGKNAQDMDEKEVEKAALEAMKKAKPVPLAGIVKKDLPALLKYVAAAYKKCGVELDVDNTDIDSSNFSNELMIPVVGTDYYLNTYLDYLEMASNGSEFVLGGDFASDEEGSLDYGTSDFSNQGEVARACTEFNEYLKNTQK